MPMWSRRSFAPALPVLLACVALGAKCPGGTGGGTTPPSAPGTATAWPKGFGEADPAAGPECTFDEIPGTKCKGFIAADFGDPNNAERIAEWLGRLGKDKNNWNDLNDAGGNPKDIERVPEDEDVPPGQRPKYGLSSIVDARRMALSKFPSGSPAGLVIGRLTVKKDQERDARYGISGNGTKKFDIRDFYVVVDQWNPVGAPKNKQFQFATWRIYGIKTGQGSAPSRAVRVSSGSGSFNWCEMTHDVADQGNGARFLTCVGATAVQTVQKNDAVRKILFARSLVEGKSLLDALEFELQKTGGAAYVPNPENVTKALKQMFAALPADGPYSFDSIFTKQTVFLLARALDAPENPAWLACGIGCCTADW